MERRYGGITLGGIIVIVGILLIFVWSFWIGLIVALDRARRLRGVCARQVVLGGLGEVDCRLADRDPAGRSFDQARKAGDRSTVEVSMGWISSFAAAVVAGLALIGSSAAADQPRVTVIGDSVLTAVEWNATPLAIFEQGLDLQLDIGVCRTLEGVSCPFEGRTVPTLLDVVNSLGPRLGKTVLIEAGYNDPPAEFAKRVEDSVDALLAAGVTRILWVNLREWQQQYIGDEPDARRRRRAPPTADDPRLGEHSHDHYSWFQGDGIHLVYDGAVGMATFLNASIKEALAPALSIATTELPVGACRPAVRRASRCHGRRRSLQLAAHLGAAAPRAPSAARRPHHGRAPAGRSGRGRAAGDRPLRHAGRGVARR